MKKIIVKENGTLLNYLYNADLPYSKSKLKSLLKHRCISINGRTTTQFNDAVDVNDEITILEYNPKLDTPLDIIYEDQNILVINKPNGLLSVPTERQNELSALDYVKDYIKGSVYVIHRLDKFTSGIMIFAKNPQTKNFFQKDWQKKAPERQYVAIVEGRIEKEKDTISSYLKESKDLYMYSSDEGKYAVTHYEMIASNSKYSALLVKLETGRRNQIRVHMADIKHPIVGDSKYGSTTNPIRRLALHAYRVTIKNPVNNRAMTFTAKVPQDFTRLVSLSNLDNQRLNSF